MSEPRLQIFLELKDSKRKFDYFIAGLVATTFAYSIQQYEPKEIECWGTALEPLSLILLLLCLGASLLKIERGIKMGSINYEILHHNDHADDFHKSLKGGQLIDMDINTGEHLTEGSLKDKMEEHQAEGTKCRKLLPKVESHSSWSSYVRTTTLVLGFVILLASKLITT